MTRPSCLVAGLGNPLMGDDGIGPAVIERITASELPAGLRAVEIGSDVSRLRSYWDQESMIWLVDAITTGAAPGTLHRIEHAGLLDLADGSSSAHDLAVPEQLRWLIHGSPELAAVRFTLWGAVPESVAPRPALTDSASLAVDTIAREILSSWRQLSRTVS